MRDEGDGIAVRERRKTLDGQVAEGIGDLVEVVNRRWLSGDAAPRATHGLTQRLDAPGSEYAHAARPESGRELQGHLV
jgi:hypothetical protein